MSMYMSICVCGVCVPHVTSFLRLSDVATSRRNLICLFESRNDLKSISFSYNERRERESTQTHRRMERFEHATTRSDESFCVHICSAYEYEYVYVFLPLRNREAELSVFYHRTFQLAAMRRDNLYRTFSYACCVYVCA